jgi:hypothetical protein
MRKEIEELEKLLEEVMARAKKIKWSYYGGIGYGEKLYIVGGRSSTFSPQVAVSEDGGLTFENDNNGNSQANPTRLLYNPSLNKIFKVGMSAPRLSEYNGTSWTTRYNTNELYDITYSSSLNIMVACRNGAVGMIYSTNGVTWNNCSGLTTNVYSLVDAGNKIIAAGAGNIIYESSDGITFTPITTNITSTYTLRLAYENGKLVGVGPDSIWHTDLNNLSTVTNVSKAGYWGSIAYSPSLDIWVITSQNLIIPSMNEGTNNTIATSTNLNTWTYRTSTATYANGVAWNGIKFYVISANTYAEANLKNCYSTDGITWIQTNAPVGSTNKTSQQDIIASPVRI